MAPLTTATNANLYYGSSAQLEAGFLDNIDTDVSEESLRMTKMMTCRPDLSPNSSRQLS